MPVLRSAYGLIFSEDAKIRRMLNYWAITAVLYLICACLLLTEVIVRAAPVLPAIWLGAAILMGSVVFYCLIRYSAFFKLSPSQLATAQGMHAIVCIIAAYAIASTVRGAVLTLLQVVLVFCAFALEPRRSHQISAFTILLLGATMVWCFNYDPSRYPADVEIVHFVLASSMMVAVVFLTSQFNWMRKRLKYQKAELEQQKNDLSDALSRLQQIAMRDDLTGLPNRRHMREVLSEEEKRHRKGDGSLSLALLDIDHFKLINDTYGHAAGDDILRGFAQQIRALLRGDDVLARWGGEEFLLLLPNTEQEAAFMALERLKHHLSSIPVDGFDSGLKVGFSSGLAVMGQGETIVDTIRRADKAMFRAKSLGRNRNCVYDPDMEAGAMAREQLKAALAYGIGAGQLVLHFQPQVTSGQVTGAEALVRWHHPERGMLYPGEFISLAEESDLILALGQWVLEEACKQLVVWSRDESCAHLSLAVNVSAKQLRHADFVSHAMGVLQATGIDPAKLKLELTESVLVENVEVAIEAMNALRKVGVRFSLDDFGTGYSSLSYLKQLPLDQIKIDRAFVSDIVADNKEGIIARAIISLSRSLGCNVLAEGVETDVQRDFLDRNGCHDFQGFLFGKPVPIELFELNFCPAPPRAEPREASAIG